MNRQKSLVHNENDQPTDANLELTLILELANKLKCSNIHKTEDLKEVE